MFIEQTLTFFVYLTIEHKNEKPIKIITGDIRNERTVINALEGVNCVIHCAALISKDLFPDEKSLKSVNVEGK